jgi:protein TonB
MTSDFDDIVFEGLNKEYGAYYLRKIYTRVLSISIIIAVLIGSTIVITPYLRYPEQKSREIYTARYVTMENLMIPDEHGGIPPPPAPPVRLRATSGQITLELKYVAPKVVDTILSIEKPIVSTGDSIISDIEGKGTDIGKGDENGAVSGSLSGSGTGAGGEGGDGTGSGLYTKVDVMPSFKGGGIDKFREWVQKKTKYPQTATSNGIQGKVYITFIIEKDGSLSNVKVARGVDPLIDDEALKSVMSSPKWTPGSLKGKAVRVSYYITVNFEL